MKIVKLVLLVVMAVFYVGGGVLHLLRPEFYLPMMPPYLPWHYALVILSGVAELLCGLGVLYPPTRK